jgi:putative nucleotidyltransferase with HDIG domain
VALLNLLSAFLMAVYLVSLNPTWADDPGYLLVITILILLFLFVGQIMVPGREGVAILFPAAALSMALTALIGFEFAAIVTIVLALTVGYLSPNSLEIMSLIGLSGLLAGGSLHKTGRLYAFFRSGVFAALTGIAVLLVFRLPGDIDALRLLELIMAAILSGLLSAGIALVILFIVSNVTGWITGLQLNDLNRPDHPLQKKLQQQALGTYQHTLSVANLVEAACECIGADSLLARVGTLYHDVGKISNPGFFGENRIEGGTNPHDLLTPAASARIIKAHVPDGIEQARRHRIPARVIDFIAEHHGTMPILFFLSAAREEAAQSGETINEADFHYDGPIPQSRETAILMLADSCESAVRAARPTSGDEIERIVTQIIQQRLDYHQLDDSGLTLGNIKTIREQLIRTLKGMYHPRVKYPDKQQPSTLPAGETEKTLPEDTRPKMAPVDGVIVEEVSEQKETL